MHRPPHGVQSDGQDSAKSNARNPATRKIITMLEKGRPKRIMDHMFTAHTTCTTKPYIHKTGSITTIIDHGIHFLIYHN
ncbi:hypothetical protein DK846_15670 [Methanospirillum lacunae]|uniref:Uncharacterized protein n=1 Tax=Methanospirillum lacunae TaxID=668570 RepID=A0A2V2MPM9_9EURY|nr:hypothetical protein DK846_15670 [Methanospirillum lacunae]